MSNGDKRKKTSIYNVTVSESTKNRKMVVCMMEYKGCTEKRALNLLSKKNAIIASDLTLNDASKVKSKINKFGYGADINKTKEIYTEGELSRKDKDIDKSKKDGNTTKKAETSIDPEENIRILEEKLTAAKVLQKEREEAKLKLNPNSGERFDNNSSFKNNKKDNKKSFNLKFKLLVFIVAILLFFIIFLLLMIFAPDKKAKDLKLVNVDSTRSMTVKEKIKSSDNKDKIKILETIFLNKQEKMNSGLEVLNSNIEPLANLIGKINIEKFNSVLKKSSKKKKTDLKRSDKMIKSDIQMGLLDPKTFFGEKYSDIQNYKKKIDKLEELLEAIQDEEQKMMVREKIKDLKRKTLSKKRNIDDFMKKFNKVYGKVKFAGNKFIGETNLPDDLKVTVKITKPNKDLILKNKVVKNGKFYVDLNGSSLKSKNRNSGIIDKGNYSVKVHIRPKSFQNEVIQNYIDQILKSNKNNSEFIDEKITLAEDVLEKKLYYKISDVKRAIKKFLVNNKKSKTNPEVKESPTIDDESVYNIVIRDRNLKGDITKEDRIKAVIKSCAATGFTMDNYTNEGKNLKIYFNDSKFPDFSIPIEKCKLAMKKVDNDLNDERFLDMILD